MDNISSFQPHKRCPSHPGLLLDEVVQANALTKTAAAKHLGISRQHLYDLIDCKKPVTPNVAVRLGTLFGNGAGLWQRMQSAYDLWHAEREVDPSTIQPLPLTL